MTNRCPQIAASAPALALHRTMGALLHEDRFPLSIVPHLVLFFSAEKAAVRLVVKDQTSRPLRAELDALGYASAEAPISIKQIGANWGQLEAVNPTAEGSMTSASHKIVVISQQETLAARILDEEMCGDSVESGRQLGYPECCVAAYPALAGCASDWPMAMLTRSNPAQTVSMWCNRLASLWGGTCPTGELFPCNLRCGAAIAVGKRADALLRIHGFTDLAEEICRQARRPLYLLDGEIVAGSGGHGTTQEIVIHG